VNCFILIGEEERVEEKNIERGEEKRRRLCKTEKYNFECT